MIGSGQKTVTGRGETGIDPRIETGLPENESARVESGSDPKIATARGRTATERMTASDALDRLTANGKRSESERDGHGHESCPTESELSDPSVLLDPKIGNHGRIEHGSGPPKLLSTHHVVERAVMSGEKQPRKRRGQGESAATEQPPPPQLPKGLKRQRCARAQRTNVQRHSPPTPLSLDRGQAGGEEASRDTTPGAP